MLVKCPNCGESFVEWTHSKARHAFVERETQRKNRDYLAKFRREAYENIKEIRKSKNIRSKNILRRSWIALFWHSWILRKYMGDPNFFHYMGRLQTLQANIYLLENLLSSKKAEEVAPEFLEWRKKYIAYLRRSTIAMFRALQSAPKNEFVVFQKGLLRDFLQELRPFQKFLKRDDKDVLRFMENLDLIHDELQERQRKIFIRHPEELLYERDTKRPFGDGTPDLPRKITTEIETAKAEATKRKQVTKFRKNRRSFTAFVEPPVAENFKAVAAAKDMGVIEYVEHLIHKAVENNSKLIEIGQEKLKEPKRYRSTKAELEKENRQRVTAFRKNKRSFTAFVEPPVAEHFKAIAAAKNMGVIEYVEHLINKAVESNTHLIKVGQEKLKEPKRYRSTRTELEKENRQLLKLLRDAGIRHPKVPS